MALLSRSRSVIVVVGLVCGVGCAGDGSAYSGTVVAEFPPAAVDEASTGGQPRWIVTLDLEGRSVAGTGIVSIAFPAAEADCQGDGVVSLDRFRVGSPVTFTRVGDSADTSDPPVIGAKDVEVPC